MEKTKLELRGVSEDHPAFQNAMPLLVEHNGVHRGCGSAVSIVPGLALTASHVVNPQRFLSQPGDVMSVTAVQVFDGELLPWSVDAIYGSAAYDIAFLRFRKPSWWEDAPDQIKRRFPRLNFNPPHPGDEVLLFGFPDSELTEGILRTTPSQCSAIVESVDYDLDDPDKPRSHAKLQGQLRPGMSGGPCFDKDWNLIGINSGGWSFRYEAYISLLWSAVRLEIDPFKTGLFPAIDLFNKGPARALGYRRVHVTSEGQALIAKVDPAGLVPIRYQGTPEQLEDAANFAAMNAQNALAEVLSLLDKACNAGEPLNVNPLGRAIRHYFWELDAALTVVLRLAAILAGIDTEDQIQWDELVAKWREKEQSNKVLDELAKLNLAWYGVDLFEIRTYAEQFRGGLIRFTVAANKERTIAVVLEPCRRGGIQLELSQGLDRFFNAATNFTQRLIRITTEIPATCE